MIDTKTLPHCQHCQSIAVQITLHYRIAKEHTREVDGLRVVDEITVQSISYRCPNFHFWRESVVACSDPNHPNCGLAHATYDGGAT